MQPEWTVYFTKLCSNSEVTVEVIRGKEVEITELSRDKNKPISKPNSRPRKEIGHLLGQNTIL